MVIKTAKFLMSNTDVRKCPKSSLLEYAFIGRSNVGKSSLINSLTNNKHLAKTSGTPGKTRLINHFKINDEWFLVDLPGYGYARTSKTDRRGFQKMIEDYFVLREQLACAFVLIDIRHAPLKIDMDFMIWLGERGIPFCLVFTKADKISKAEILSNVEAYKKAMLEFWEYMPEYFITSSVKKEGQKEILDFIDKINKGVH